MKLIKLNSNMRAAEYFFQPVNITQDASFYIWLTIVYISINKDCVRSSASRGLSTNIIVKEQKEAILSGTLSNPDDRKATYNHGL